MQGTRDSTQLWTINCPQTTNHSLNSIIDAPTIAERIKYYTASLSLPPLSTLATAISAGFLTTFPDFTIRNLRKYAPIHIAIPMVHLHAKRSNLQSTTKRSPITNAMAPVHIIEDEPAIPITSPEPSHPPWHESPAAYQTQSPIQSQIDRHPNMDLDVTLLHPPTLYLVSNYPHIPTQGKTRSRYALAIDTLSQMPSSLNAPTTRTK